MVEEKLAIGLVVERRPIESGWADAQAVSYHWRPVSVFPYAPEVAPWTPLGTIGSATRYYAGEIEIALYSTETTNYRDNLLTGAPKLWVVMRAEDGDLPITVAAVTADPAEGEAYTEAGTSIVETVDMPCEVAGEIARFIAEHHVERPILKRKRDRAEPDVRWRPGEGPRAADGSTASSDDTPGTDANERRGK